MAETTTPSRVKKSLSIAIASSAQFQLAGRSMTEPDTLDQTIQALKQSQRMAWEQLADPALTTFARRELRNEIKQTGAELRSCLQMMSERSRFRVRPPVDAGDSLEKFEFRLLA
jgi:hypothetical protein